MSNFVYRALTPGQRRIRLIYLLPNSSRDRPTKSSIQQLSNAGACEPQQVAIACTISHVSLDQPPPYFALSYTWGDTCRNSRILVDGTTFHVTKSLEVALLHLTPQDVPLTLWIDALSINQDDEAEKTEQVQQMQQIYARATSVIAWLGPTTVNSDAAMLWILRYGSLAQSFGIGTKPELRLRRLLQIFESNPDKLPRQIGLEEFLRDISRQLSSESHGNESIVMALSELFGQAYWSRVWVVQELVHGKCVQFVCGNMAVPEESVHHSLRLMKNFGHYEHLKFAQNPQVPDPKFTSTTLNVRNPVNIFKIRRARGHFPLIYLIRTLRYFQSTDPRDRIFALLSFAVDAVALGLKPDYQKSCKEVYLETTIALAREGFMDIFSLCIFDKNIPDLPSWVPDFTSMNQRVPLQQRAMNRKAVPVATILQPEFSASVVIQNTSFSYELMQKSPASLLLSAKLVDRVTRVGTTWDQQAFARWLQELSEFSTSDSVRVEPDHLKAVWGTAVADQEIRQGDQKPRLSQHELEKVHNSLKSLNVTAADQKKLVSLGLGDYVYQLQDVAFDRRPFCTSRGRIGIGPCEMAAGDLLYVLIGAPVPYSFRPDTHDRLRLIGEAYVHGIMDGEAMKDDQPIDVIELC